MDRGKFTAEITRGLRGKIAVVMGGRRHSSDTTAVGTRKQITWVGGVPFFHPVQRRFEAEKGHPQGLRGARLLFVVRVL